jgi:hypothetical protein
MRNATPKGLRNRRGVPWKAWVAGTFGLPGMPRMPKSVIRFALIRFALELRIMECI